MKRSELFHMAWPEGLPFTVKEMPETDPEIKGICYRSDRVEPGDLFVAVSGHATDGHRYAKDAASRGAVLLVAERPVPEAGIPTILVDDSRRALSALSAAFFGFPAEHLTLIGVTGTNGKTTTARITETILAKAGFATGGIGTIDCHYAGTSIPAANTTPESHDLHATLAAMRDAGITHVVMEVSSHGADLGRIADIPFAVAVFTNLTQDHLDYHGDLATYWGCKRRFLETVARSKANGASSRVVLNMDDPHGEDLINGLLKEGLADRLLSVGTHPDAIIRPGSPRFSLSGIRTTISTPEAAFPVAAPLVGGFNLENILCATGAAVALGIDANIIKKALESDIAVPGRLEPVFDTKGRFVFVDYAHTPDALEKVLRTVRHLTEKRLITVFGCGGDRDVTKRPLMGKIAAEIADLCVITSDNPRTEDPDAIIQDICEGMQGGANIIVEPDRESAILTAIAKAEPEDAVVIAGKGHETYQIIGAATLDFDDRTMARKGLSPLA